MRGKCPNCGSRLIGGYHDDQAYRDIRVCLDCGHEE